MSTNKNIRNQKVMNVNDILQRSSLSSLIERHNHLQQFYQDIEKLIPAQFRGKMRLAELTENSILFHVANGVVYQSLLFQQAQLLANIQQQYPNIKQLTFKVIPSLS
ncbi:DciA family protein [Gallibacterium salpingitidis]|uniref:DciA family protein n=1 Tax=Gallibacterium salpingitidis TaxID=505341 RepID=UPI0009EDF4D7|nr:DciA family protein [Gallibacterium salpingitidis]WKS99142.1 DciA family protein [Gallibacterium salpingitidis]